MALAALEYSDLLFLWECLTKSVGLFYQSGYPVILPANLEKISEKYKLGFFETFEKKSAPIKLLTKGWRKKNAQNFGK